MLERADVYCNLFVDANLDVEDLAFKLSKIFVASADKLGNIKTDLGEISITKNDDYNDELKKDKEEGFLYYRFLLEVEPYVRLGEGNAIQFVSKILKYLWSEDYPATAACAYEDALPNKGKLIPENHSWNEYYIWK
jgi:hypothetical protein